MIRIRIHISEKRIQEVEKIVIFLEKKNKQYFFLELHKGFIYSTGKASIPPERTSTVAFLEMK
jgi:hypothetical protein